jgi:hypothetical protein
VILRKAGWTPHPLTRGLSVNGFVRNLPCRRADSRCLACGHLLALSVNVCWRRLAAVDRLGMLGAGPFDVAQVLLQDAKGDMASALPLWVRLRSSLTCHPLPRCEI